MRQTFAWSFALQDNAPAYTSKVVQAAIRDCGFEELSHPRYSLHLAPSDFYLFRLLKKQLRGRRFCDDVELKGVSERCLEEAGKNFYEKEIKELPGRWLMCIEVRGGYVEKYE